MIRVRLFEQEMVKQRCVSRGDDSKIKIAAIGEPKTEDMPLWQQDWLSFQVGVKKGDMRHNEEKYAQEPATSADELKIRGYILQQCRNAIVTYEKAYEVSKLDGERLCPGKTLEQVRGGPFFWDKTTQMEVDELDTAIKGFEKDCESIKDKIKIIPSTVTEAKQYTESLYVRELESVK